MESSSSEEDFFVPEGNCRSICKAVSHLKRLHIDYFAHHSHSVTDLEEAPSSSSFMRHFLLPNIPVLYRNAVGHWPAVEKWTTSYLKDKLQNKELTVALTPDGYADAVRDEKFVMPEEKRMTFTDFSDVLLKPKPSSIYYIQKQDNNFIDEFQPLHKDVELDIPWATEAIGKKPDAVNFWMGDERAITSLHKDNYENIYCVIKGHKQIILYAPVDTPWIPYKKYLPFKYSDVEGDCKLIQTSEAKVPWSPLDPVHPDYSKYNHLINASPFLVTVSEGDVLYIPALWYHHVRQSHGCIAVNYWYDMSYDTTNYSLVQYLERMRKLIKKPQCKAI